jgi:hypothetical protein
MYIFYLTVARAKFEPTNDRALSGTRGGFLEIIVSQNFTISTHYQQGQGEFVRKPCSISSWL